MDADADDNEVLSVTSVLNKLQNVGDERDKLVRRVRELELKIESITMRQQVLARKRESAILMNAAQAIAEMDRLQSEREGILNEKLKRAEEEIVSIQRREQGLERELTQAVISRNGEMVSQARFDELQIKVQLLERERDKLATSNMYLKQVVENCRISSVKPLKNKSTQTDSCDQNQSFSKSIQVGKSKVKRKDSLSNSLNNVDAESS